ncbi:integrin alpha-X-like [Vicugna pacos]|uniref:Integrin alpha-X-like n=1 Tax=Vicugna pacos TaxID=30538 RepID=A0ABM5BPB9_VICPA
MRVWKQDQITFMATFDVSPTAMLGDRLLLTANVSSENNTPRTSKTTFQLELPVKYAVYTVISSHEESTKYLNFSASEEKDSRRAQHRYQVNNLGQGNLPASIDFSVPVELNRVKGFNNFMIRNLSKLEADIQRLIEKNQFFLALLF